MIPPRLDDPLRELAEAVAPVGLAALLGLALCSFTLLLGALS